VSLGGLLSEMSAVELDFLRSCLIIDENARKSVAELMNHSYFGGKFKEEFELEFAELLR